MLPPTESSNVYDALSPPQIAKRVEEIGRQKATQDVATTFVLAILAGAFIAWGAAFATTVTTGANGVLPFGVTKLLGGLVFCLGLVLVVVAGAELFTGNNLIVMAWSSGKISTKQLLRNWAVVYTGNFVGAVSTAVLIFLTGQAEAAGGAVGDNMMRIAEAKCTITPVQAVAAGIGCNVLVCLAVWLCMAARSVADKILAIVFPITAFVATDMQHCVANMYFVPLGLMIRKSLGTAAHSDLTIGNFLWSNLLPVTIGNIIGGTVLVGLVYWFVFLRGQRGAEK